MTLFITVDIYNEKQGTQSSRRVQEVKSRNARAYNPTRHTPATN